MELNWIGSFFPSCRSVETCSLSKVVVSLQLCAVLCGDTFHLQFVDLLHFDRLQKSAFLGLRFTQTTTFFQKVLQVREERVDSPLCVYTPAVRIAVLALLRRTCLSLRVFSSRSAIWARISCLCWRRACRASFSTRSSSDSLCR